MIAKRGEGCCQALAASNGCLKVGWDKRRHYEVRMKVRLWIHLEWCSDVDIVVAPLYGMEWNKIIREWARGGTIGKAIS